MGKTAEVFARNMKKLRATHGYTLQQVGEYIGVSRENCSRWESPNPSQFVFPGHENIDKIADLYKISVSDLFRVKGAAEKSMAVKPTQEDALIIVNRLLSDGLIQLRKAENLR